MKTIGKLLVGAALAGGLAMATAAPADAGIRIGIGIGGPGYYGGHPGRWCYYHPGACGGYAGPYVEGGYWAGHGYYHGGRWYGHREGWRGGWRYR
jgi:hypothetical protein